jgi:hypothetical protein
LGGWVGGLAGGVSTHPRAPTPPSPLVPAPPARPPQDQGLPIDEAAGFPPEAGAPSNRGIKRAAAQGGGGGGGGGGPGASGGGGAALNAGEAGGLGKRPRAAPREFVDHDGVAGAGGGGGGPGGRRGGGRGGGGGRGRGRGGGGGRGGAADDGQHPFPRQLQAVVAQLLDVALSAEAEEDAEASVVGARSRWCSFLIRLFRFIVSFIVYSGLL